MRAALPLPSEMKVVALATQPQPQPPPDDIPDTALALQQRPRKTRMYDLKMCLLDLIGMQGTPKPKKTLKEFSNRYSSNFMKKYNDLNVIQFNENMAMTSRNNTLRFTKCHGAFTSVPITNNFMNRRKSIRDWGIETISFEFSSDDRQTCVETSTDDNKSDEIDADQISNAQATLSIDSICTLCTSSFSYSNCNNCQLSICSSKCSVDDSCTCCTDSYLTR